VETDGVEREVKLDAGVGFRVPDFTGVWPGLSIRTQPAQHLNAVYVDTPDLRLIRSGLTLRHRTDRGTGRGTWTLKLPVPEHGAALSRRELNWPGTPGPVPAEIASLVRAYRRTASLGPVARLVTLRQRVLVCDRFDEALLEIDDDVVSVMDGRRLAARFREVEVEVVGPAPEALLNAIVDRLRDAGAVPAGGPPKVARALGARAVEPPDVVPVTVRANTTMGETVRAAVAHGYLRLLAHDLGVRLADDPEDVHQARVATRRLRSDLRTFRAFLPEGWDVETRQELGWVAEALGRARDADVLLDRLQGHVQGLEADDARAAGTLVARLVDERDQAHEALLAVMDSERYGRLMDRLVDAAHELPPLKVDALEPAPEAVIEPQPATAPPEVTAEPAADAEAMLEPVALQGATLEPGGAVVPVEPVLPGDMLTSAAPGPHTAAPVVEADRDATARQLAAGVVAGPWRHVNRAVQSLGAEPADDALHEVRIRAKRLRYASEAVAGVVGKPAGKLARAAADLQGILGDFHDAIVAEQWLRSASQTLTVPEALAAGQLIALERAAAEKCRAQWHASWKRLHRRKLRAWLR
jgi:CHAD domain-containing protein